MLKLKKNYLGPRTRRLPRFLILPILCMFSVSINAKSIEEDFEEEVPKHDEDVGLQQEDKQPQAEKLEQPTPPQQTPPAEQQEQKPLASDDKKAPHTFVEKIQAALDSKNSKIMHSYLKELMRLRINLDKIKDDLQDVTYDDAEEIKGLKEFLEYLDFAINHGMECIQAGLKEDRNNVINAIPEMTEAPRIEFTVKPIDKAVVLQMMESVRNLKTCLRDQKKRCKRLYAEAKEAIVVAQERLTEAIEAYTDLLQHIEGKAYVKQEAKPEDEDEEDDDVSRGHK